MSGSCRHGDAPPEAGEQRDGDGAFRMPARKALMKVPAPFQVHDTSDLPEYPISPDERLESHYFVPFWFNRWRNSDFRLRASAEVRGYGLDLFFIAQNQSPVGTLPTDDAVLAKLLMIDLATWKDLCSREITPLYNWSPCRCGDKVRLMHPVVTEQALDALKRKRGLLEARERERERKRLVTLKRQIVEAGGSSRMAASADYLARLDAWLMRNCTGNRTPARVREAMEALEQGL